MPKKLVNEQIESKQPSQLSQVTFNFIKEENKDDYKKIVLNWLEFEFNKLGKPSNHFWHNKPTIEEAFDKCNVMIILNQEKEFIGYLIWHFYGAIGAEIDIIEIKENYRRQGILKKALETFCNKFSSICVLSATVLPQAEKAFSSVGWQKIENKYVHIIKPVSHLQTELPDGQVIATCVTDFYFVKNNREIFKNYMLYFQVNLDENKQLSAPIITEFSNDGYVGIYKDKKLITEGKAKHLFAEGWYIRDDSFLIITSVIPEKEEVFKDFFSVSLEKSQKINDTRNAVLPAINSSSSLSLNTYPLIFSQSVPQNETLLTSNQSGEKRLKRENEESAIDIKSATHTSLGI